MTGHLLRRVSVPIAHEKDASVTARALEEFLGGAGVTLHFIHVIEKAGGAPDKAPLEARQQQAKAIFEIVETHFAETDVEVRTELRYGTSVSDEIIAGAIEFDTTAIVFVPRDGSRIAKLLSGNLTQRLVSNDRIPVLVLPRSADE